jgi:ATP-binding cassette subfamily B (MDR/TAP) protein 1
MNVKDDGKFKARFIVRGCEQKQEIDYKEIYSPTVDFTSPRTLLAVAAKQNLNIKSFDIKTAFLHGELNEDIYMKLPEGYEENTGKTCRLKKALYGLKQAPLLWNK